MRVFVAIDPSDAARDALESLQDHIKVGRLTDPETYHITLAFLGDQSDAILDGFHEALESINLSPFTLQLRGLGTFGAKSPKVVWAGLEPNSDLDRLHGKVRGAARQAGIELPRERFRPHVTLARFGDRIDLTELERLKSFLERFNGFPSPPFEIQSFRLYQSILRSDGAIHEPLAEYALG
ncbi:RNA 2',3'-cyclic phosphodiesterase [Pseudoruegeria sp. HB172150]|uniref:RNA 2',3'-cyclic phosphodiesterase n=1 Tax=Pseudoruegeria sp. HB172150 TaxID=2721164 RepID=UPI001554D0CA|nr:RNA 2',3'-cyclic phosphodiesterase [Pseudoruegeria sp. HB172150]